MYLAEATPGQWPQDSGGGGGGVRFWLPGTSQGRLGSCGQALPQPTRSLCVHLPATVSGFLWKGKGRQAGSELWAARSGFLSVFERGRGQTPAVCQLTQRKLGVGLAGGGEWKMDKGLLSLLLRSLEYRVASPSPKPLSPVASRGGSQLAQNIPWWYLGSSKAGFWFSVAQNVPTTRSVGGEGATGF